MLYGLPVVAGRTVAGDADGLVVAKLDRGQLERDVRFFERGSSSGHLIAQGTLTMTAKTTKKTHQDHIDSLTAEERAEHDAEVARVYDEIQTSRRTVAAVLKARALTQVAMAEMLGTTQGEVSRIENTPDLYLSTLARYIEAMGGELELVARFGDDEALPLAIGDITG